MKSLARFIKDNSLPIVPEASEFNLRVLSQEKDGDYRTAWIVQLRPLDRDGETLFYRIDEFTNKVEPCDYNGVVQKPCVNND